jgi:hypothetical protein
LQYGCAQISESLPLLPCTLPPFVRAPEGIFVSFYPEPKIFLERREMTDNDYPVFELASCRRCGQEYLVGNIVNNVIDNVDKRKLRQTSSESRQSK